MVFLMYVTAPNESFYKKGKTIIKSFLEIRNLKGVMT